MNRTPRDPSMHCAAGHEFTMAETGRGPDRKCPLVLSRGPTFEDALQDFVKPKRCGKSAHYGLRIHCAEGCLVKS